MKYFHKISVFLFLFWIGCAPKILVPPRISLPDYGSIGLIEFQTDADGEMGSYATQIFLQNLLDAQQDAAIIELGTPAFINTDNPVSVLNLSRDNYLSLNADFGTGAVFSGYLQVSQVKPKVDLMPWSFSVKGVIQVRLQVKLIEISSGKTLWSWIEEGEDTVSGLTIISEGPVIFEAGSADETFGPLVRSMIWSATQDFREHYVRRR